MRIISQDGAIDMPYEQVVIQRFGSEISFLNKNLAGVEQLVDDMVVAKYSTEEKAKKAMEMLREEYGKYVSATGANSYFAFVHPKVFQFPAEEELE